MALSTRRQQLAVLCCHEASSVAIALINTPCIARATCSYDVSARVARPSHVGRAPRSFLLQLGHLNETRKSHVVALAHARTRLQIDTYETLHECRANASCAHLPEAAVASAYTDLCWALLHDRLERDASEARVRRWHALFLALSGAELVHDDCACCMQRRTQASAACKWTWTDKCQRLALAINS